MTVHVSPHLTRRRLLAGSAAFGLAGFAPNRFGNPAYAKESDCGPQPIALRCDEPAESWQSLAKKLTGPLLRPDDTRFLRYAQPFNLAYDTEDRRPRAIALCTNRRDVATAIQWATKNGQKIVARSGGHSYAGYSTGGCLMIDVSLLNRFSWNAGRNELTVGSGARNGDVYNVLRAENRTLTHGRCPTVGIAGFLLGGGIGFNMRMYGLGSDRLVASEIVTADGTVLNLSAIENEDLFWACRGGGGGNFGINTSFTLETVPADELVTVFSLQWNTSRGNAEEIVDQLMTALDAGDNRLGSRFKFSRVQNPDRDAIIDLLGQFHGGENDARALLSGVLSRSPEPTSQRIVEMRYWDGQDFLLDWDGPFRFTERSLFLEQKLDAAAIHEAFEGLWQLQPSSDRRLAADVRFFQTGGRINDVPADATAFVHRNSRWLMDFGLPWGKDDPQCDVDANKKLLGDLFNQFAVKSKYGRGRSYQNFIDPALLRDKSAIAYYGENLPRLRNVKRKYDPTEVFKFDQSIEPA